MKIKYLLIALLLVFALLFGCESNKEESESNTKINDVISIKLYNAISLKDSMVENYLNYLKSSFNLEINSQKLETLSNIKEVDGILKISIMTFEEVLNEKEENFLPLNDYIKNSTFLSLLPASLINITADSDGQIWGILASHRFETLSRVYNEEIMVELGENVPNNLIEFMSLNERVKENYDIPFMKIDQENCLEAFYDIFAAFDVPLYNGKYTIGWDEKSEKFIDLALSAEMAECLKFIKELNKNNQIEVSKYPINDFSNVFTYSKNNSNGLFEKYTTNMFDNSFIRLEKDLAFIFVLPINTNEPKITLDNFITSFYENDKINKSGRLGIEGEDYKYIDENFVILLEGTKIRYPIISDYWINNKYILLKSEDEIADYEDWVNIGYKEIKEDFYNNSYKIVPLEHTINKFERMGVEDPKYSELHKTFSKVFYRFIENDFTVNEFLSEYQKIQQSMGIDEYFEAKNRE